VNISGLILNSALNANNQKITKLATPTFNDDAAMWIRRLEEAEESVMVVSAVDVAAAEHLAW